MRPDYLYQLDQRIKETRKAINLGNWQLFHLLKIALDNKIWKTLDYPSWNSYLAQEEISIRPETVDKYLRTLEILEALKLPVQAYNEIPKSKVRAIAPHLNEENASELLGKAKHLSWTDLQKEIGENGKEEIQKPYLVTKWNNQANKWEFIRIEHIENLINYP